MVFSINYSFCSLFTDFIYATDYRLQVHPSNVRANFQFGLGRPFYFDVHGYELSRIRSAAGTAVCPTSTGTSSNTDASTKMGCHNGRVIPADDEDAAWATYELIVRAQEERAQKDGQPPLPLHAMYINPTLIFLASHRVSSSGANSGYSELEHGNAEIGSRCNHCNSSGCRAGSALFFCEALRKECSLLIGRSIEKKVNLVYTLPLLDFDVMAN